MTERAPISSTDERLGFLRFMSCFNLEIHFYTRSLLAHGNSLAGEHNTIKKKRMVEREKMEKLGRLIPIDTAVEEINAASECSKALPVRYQG